MAKLAWAHVRHGLGPAHFALYELQNKPVGTYGDYLKLYPNVSKGLRIVNDSSSDPAIRSDKARQTERMIERGVPVAPVLAVAGRDLASEPLDGRLRVLDDRDALLAFLSDRTTPAALFVKPCGSDRGIGIFAAERAGAGWRVDEAECESAELADRILGAGGPKGVLIQERLRSHCGLQPVGGEFGLMTLRINTARTRDGIEVFFIVAKLFTKPSLIDNFLGGVTGNLLASVDPETGVMGPAYGRKPGDRLLLTRFDVHPATGMPITGFRVPEIGQLTAAAAGAADAFPTAALQGSDVALTDAGAFVIERNTHWETSLPQLTHGVGLRPKLRNIWPRLDLDSEKRRRAEPLLIG